MIAFPHQLRVSTGNRVAAAAFEEAVTQFAAHRPGVAEALARALHADPVCIAALAFDGFMQVLLARRETLEAARRRLAQVRSVIPQVEPTASEVALIEALALACDGNLTRAAARIERRLEADPLDFAGVKLAHALRFMAGDQRGMLAATGRVLPAWSAAEPAFGYVLGCHAFGLGEAGRLSEAEAHGRRAVELAPDDAWGIHAVAHVHETRGMTKAGIGWLETTRPVWSQCNNFAYHMAWHLALFYLERSEPEAG